GFATMVWQNFRIHHCSLSGALAPRAVGVPIECALVGMLAARITVLVEVGQRVDLRMLFVAVVLAKHVDLHLAKIACKSHLRRWRQIDITKQDHLVIEKGFKTLANIAGDTACASVMPIISQPRTECSGCDLKRPIARRVWRF